MALLYERISTHVLEEIRSGALRPGDRVASEMELAAQFEVSRITSKRALEVLREAGLIERIRGKGSFVVKQLPNLDGVTTPLKGALRPARYAEQKHQSCRQGSYRVRKQPRSLRRQAHWPGTRRRGAAGRDTSRGSLDCRAAGPR